MINPDTIKTVLYEPGQTSIHTILKNDRCLYSGELVENMITKNPKLKVMTFDNALIKIQKIQTKKYNKPWLKITEEKFMEMLEILPPLKWNTTNGVEMFAMSEFDEGTYTGHYAHYKGKYYYATRMITCPRCALVEELKKQIGEI